MVELTTFLGEDKLTVFKNRLKIIEKYEENKIKQDKLIKDALKLSDEEIFIPFSTVTKKGREDVLKIIESYL